MYVISHKIFIHTLDILLYGYHLFQNLFITNHKKSILNLKMKSNEYNKVKTKEKYCEGGEVNKHRRGWPELEVC